MKIKDFFFKNINTRQTIFKNAFWLIGGQIFSRLIRAVIIIYAIRILGPADYGIFTYAYGLATVLMTFIDIGIAAFLTREAATNNELKEKYFGTAFIIKSFLLIISASALILIGPIISSFPEAKAILPILAIMMVLESMRDFFNAIPRSQEKMQIEGIINIATNVIMVGAGLILLSIKPTAASLAWAYLIGNAIGIIITSFYLWPQIHTAILNFQKKLVGQILKIIWPVAITQAFGAFLVYTDIIVLGWLADKTSVGYYGAAIKPVQLLLSIPYLFSMSIFPLISKKAAQKNSAKVTEQGIKILMLFAIPMVIFLFALAPQIIKLFYGIDFAPSIEIFRILIFLVLVNYPYMLMQSSVFVHNDQAKNLPWLISSALLNIAGSYILIKAMGINGAAIAALSAQTLFSFGIWTILKKKEDFKIIKNLKIGIIAGIAMIIFAVLAEILKINWLITAFILPIAYLLTLIILKEPFIYELTGLWKLLTR